MLWQGGMNGSLTGLDEWKLEEPPGFSLVSLWNSPIFLPCTEEESDWLTMFFHLFDSEGGNGSFQSPYFLFRSLYHSLTWHGIHSETSDKWEAKRKTQTKQLCSILYPPPPLHLQLLKMAYQYNSLTVQTSWSHLMPLNVKSQRLNPSSTYWPMPHAWLPCSYTVVQSYLHAQRMLNLYDWETEKS